MKLIGLSGINKDTLPSVSTKVLIGVGVGIGDDISFAADIDESVNVDGVGICIDANSGVGAPVCGLP